jgi:hypothetical protein
MRRGGISGARDDNGTATIESKARFCIEFETMTAGRLFPIHDDRTFSRSSDAGVLNLIASREQYSRTLIWDEQLDATLEALTLDEVNAAFRRHVNISGLSIVKGGDFKAANVYK